MSEFGAFALAAAFVVSLYGTGASLAGSLLKQRQYGATSRWRSLISSSGFAVYLNFALLTASCAALLFAFLTRDFSLLYVFEHSNLALPGVYTATAFWSGQEGSLLLWAWMLAGCAAFAIFTNRKGLPDLIPWAVFVFLLNSSFFLLLLNFISNPFAAFPGPIPSDGYGLNPVLRDPGMIIHPPTLFLGYAGLTIPYAFGISALFTGKSDSGWIEKTQIWTLVSWFLLGFGILLGAEWAYVELGWGGYWAWDPVENASLMPWLTATAFLHSAMIWRRKGMLKIWSMSLIIITYFLIIFGTFVTRSGLVSSVHAYGNSSLGCFLFILMLLVLVPGLLVVRRRKELLSSETRIESLVSKESAFLATNLVFSAMVFSVFWGTIFPVLMKAVKGAGITVGAGYYNKVNVPIALTLMFLMGACPLLQWRYGPGNRFYQVAALPSALGVSVAAAAYAAGIRHWASILVVALAAFILGSVVMVEIYQCASAKKDARDRHFHAALLKTIWSNKRRYGGYAVHLGIAIIFIGISGAPLTTEAAGTLKPGESLSVGEYTLKYMNMAWIPAADGVAVATRLQAFRSERAIGYVVPERRFYEKKEGKPTSEVSIIRNWREDLYVAITGYDSDGRASFRVLVNPLVPWLWYGGYIAGLGILLAVLPRGRDGSGSG